ncbi:3-dehydroquinate synthase [Ferruginibacter albus]|uniref:3-dehydroquinate synthase n=1 Tax=Ferruginibacter albus TaxID=2875540 RepID=UPI001CC59465|nr:3-dehydroquinate synthase [Ferruginibacter albus]UAY53508.1 3-dehydroquinate synthase [Ferruginibacter albus]
MSKQTYKFSNSSTDFYFADSINSLKNIVDVKNAIFITDENIFKAHEKKFKNYQRIILPPGEAHKNQDTVNSIIQQLIAFEADRKTVLIGVGGGVVTDITGFVASTYMRGIKFGFIPTTLLALVDASIGGKNGIDIGVYKNIVGVTRQPSFILHDYSFLNSLPESEWQNGFAEIIKHACIKDAAMFKELQQHSLKYYFSKKKEAAILIQRNAKIKLKVVQADEFEQNERRLLNFGHTLGHALENQYELSHGQAISIGMTYASHISQQLFGFKQTEAIVKTFEQYGLPTYFQFDKSKVFDVLKMDKKRERKEMNYILLEKIGKGVVKQIPLIQLEKIIQSL